VLSVTRRRQGLVLASAVAVAVGLAALARPDPGAGSPFESAARIVDRTFRCTPTAVGNGLRELTVDTVPITATERSAQDPSPGFIGVISGGWAPSSDFVSIRARRWQRFGTPVNSWQGVYANTARCASSRRSVSLSSKGLPGPPIRWQERERCVVPGRILVRFRAVLQAPALWRRISGSYLELGAMSSMPRLPSEASERATRSHTWSSTEPVRRSSGTRRPPAGDGRKAAPRSGENAELARCSYLVREQCDGANPADGPSL
jgi:hypothetical protein